LSSRPAYFALATALVLSALAPACDRGDATTAAAQSRPAPREVRVSPAESGSLPRVVIVTGTLAAEEQVDLGMKVAGRLAEIAVDLGSRAAKGDALARLVTTDFELRVQQADAALQQARSRLGLGPDDPDSAVDPEQTSVVRQARAVLQEARLARERAQHLLDESLIPRSDFDAAEAAYQVAEGRAQDAFEEVHNRQALLVQRRTELELARQALKDSVLIAPYDGAVRQRLASPGQFVAVGQPIVTLVRVHPLRLKLAVPERESAGLREGLEVRLTVEGDPIPHRGRIARLSPAIEEGSRTLSIEAEVPNPDGKLRPGSFARAEIETAAGEPVILVPVASIVTFAGIEKVIVVRDGAAAERRVRTGRRVEGRVEILEGLVAGEPVVLEPGTLASGQPVTIAG
jgi:RND family efflux transporter MFP subunit